MKTGDYLGRYKIVRKIGEGGMGEVFLAEDQKLNRQIALKVLSADFASDSDRMLRFIHEAKSASALNHPNIITIYEILDENEPPFIAMEFVEGETLGRRMKLAPLEVHETVDISIQIATALAAAHGANVVHRDIKPDNVILRPDGLIKVLDFGLAKQVERPDEADLEIQTMQNVHTRPGLVMGTVAYMSPEQARGKQVDSRSDIFSFGAMLYQMVSGRMPFVGENDIDTVGSILHKEPRPLSESARVVPHDLDLVIRKALRKNRDERYQTMRELLADLKEIREDLRLNSAGRPSQNGHSANGNSGSELNDLERGMPTEQMPAARVHSTQELSIAPSTLSGILMSEIKAHPVRSLGFSMLVAALLAGAAFGIFRAAETFRNPESFETMKFEKLTYSGDVASEQAAVSPDGKYFAYVQEVAGEESLWVKQTQTDSNVRIIGPTAKRYNGLTFAPDANYVYFTVIEKEGTSSLYQVPVLGGPTRKIASEAKGPIAFSPDGQSILFVRDETQLFCSNADGSNAREIARAGDQNRWLRFSWSPNGKEIAAAYFSAADSNDHLAKVSVSDGSITEIASSWQRIRGVAWLRDGRLLISGRDPETQLSQIWMVDPVTGMRRRVTNDLSSYQGLSVTSDGQMIVSTQQNTLSNIWKSGPGSKPVRVTTEKGKNDGMSGLALTPDGRILYTTRIRGNQDIWIVNGDGTGSRQLTFNSGANFSPAVAPGGEFIVFVSTRAGAPTLWRMDMDGGDQRQLTSEPGAQTEPDFTPDGRWVLFQLTDPSNVSTIWKVPAEGGRPVQLTKIDSIHPKVSPDGRYFVCDFGLATPENGLKVGIFSMEGGESISSFEFPAIVRSRNIRWTADGRSLLYVEGKEQVDNIWSIPVSGGPARQITDFTAEKIFRFDVSPVTGQLVYARGTDTSDAVLITHFH